MADQGRWFKLWVSAPADDSLQSLPPALRWAWVAFGAYTKLHGTQGRVDVSTSNAVLAAELGVPTDTLLDTIRALPHVHIVAEKRYDASIVTVSVEWDNWRKYQEDATVAERMKKHRALRSKKRREEMRREETLLKRKTKTPPPPPSSGEEGVAAAATEGPSEDSPNGHQPTRPWPSPEALVALYNAETPGECPAVTRLSPARREKARRYLAAFPDQAFWLQAFRRIHESRFLRGFTAGRGQHPFLADFDWLLTKGKDGSENVVKVVDGKYTD